MYVAVRDAEGRIIDDNLLKMLPATPTEYKYAHEWTVRSKSFARFSQWLLRRYEGKAAKILDVGCGNGWMSARLADAGHNVTGIDLNYTELEQAERVFGNRPNLCWLYADILKDDIPGGKFDIALFGASCQYFPDISRLTERCKTLMNAGGSIHLLDSFFYTVETVDAARERTKEYYSQLGFGEMAGYYFHHTKETLRRVGYRKLYPTVFSPQDRPQWWVCQV